MDLKYPCVACTWVRDQLSSGPRDPDEQESPIDAQHGCPESGLVYPRKSLWPPQTAMSGQDSRINPWPSIIQCISELEARPLKDLKKSHEHISPLKIQRDWMMLSIHKLNSSVQKLLEGFHGRVQSQLGTRILGRKLQNLLGIGHSQSENKLPQSSLFRLAFTPTSVHASVMRQTIRIQSAFQSPRNSKCLLPSPHFCNLLLEARIRLMVCVHPMREPSVIQMESEGGQHWSMVRGKSHIKSQIAH